MRRVSAYFTLLFLTGTLLGQTAWDGGTFSMTYGFPFPNQSWDASGSFLNTQIPAEGVGGFQITTNDTSIIALLAYEIYTQDADTLADAFLVVLQQEGSIDPGTYNVNILPGALSLFAWFEEVDPEMIAGLLDTAFDFESLSDLNPYLSVSGSITVQSVGPASLALELSGMMLNTDLAFNTVSSATFNVQNSLPVPVYSLGSLSYSENGSNEMISGDLNPLISDDGVGVLVRTAGDTLTYTLLAYSMQSSNVYDVFGLEVTGSATFFPETGFEATVPLTLDTNVFPRATPMVVPDLDLAAMLSVLQSGDIGALTALEQVLVPVGFGDCQFSRDPEHIELSFENLLMASLDGSNVTVGQAWYAANQWPVALDEESTLTLPQQDILVGAAYPNPFNSSTIIPFELDQSQKLELVVYNILGQEKSRLDLGLLSQGRHTQRLDLDRLGLAGGFYHFQLINEASQSAQGSFLYLK